MITFLFKTYAMNIDWIDISLICLCLAYTVHKLSAPCMDSDREALRAYANHIIRMRQIRDYDTARAVGFRSDEFITGSVSDRFLRVARAGRNPTTTEATQLRVARAARDAILGSSIQRGPLTSLKRKTYATKTTVGRLRNRQAQISTRLFSLCIPRTV